MAQKIIVLGPPRSGKTCLLHHITRSYFKPFAKDEPYKPTIGVDIVGINNKHNINKATIESINYYTSFRLIKYIL